jgi:hypothetical protein
MATLTENAGGRGSVAFPNFVSQWPDKQSVGGGTESCSTESLINANLWLNAMLTPDTCTLPVKVGCYFSQRIHQRFITIHSNPALGKLRNISGLK